MKTIKKKIKMGNEKDISDMFNQMLGTDSAINKEIVEPKLRKIVTILQGVKKLIKLINEVILSKIKKEWSDEFTTFENGINDLINYSAGELTAETWKTIRDSVILVNIMNVSVTLDTFGGSKLFIKTDDKYKHAVFSESRCASITPFTFTSIDLKTLFELDESERQFIMSGLHKLHIAGCELYKLISSPDIDIKKFSDIMIESLDKLRTIPELSRCNVAFDKLKSSLSMLENNFTDYYKDFIVKKDSSIIMENFILDVSKTTKASPTLMIQFRKIITYYKKKTAGNIKDPKLKMAFDKLNENFEKIERMQAQGETKSETKSDAGK